jgi:hypothetical protein
VQGLAVPPQQQPPPQRQSFGIRLEPVPANEAAKTPEIHVNGFRNKAVRPRATRLTLDSASLCCSGSHAQQLHAFDVMCTLYPRQLMHLSTR